MATQAHAPATNILHRYRRVVRLPVTGASIGGQVSLVDGDRDMVILGTIAAFGVNGLQSLTSNFGHLNPAAAGGSNVVGLTASTAATASTTATVNGASTGPTPHNTTIASTVNGVATGPSPPTPSTALTANGTTPPTFPSALTASTVNGAATGPTFPNASTNSTVNGPATGPPFHNASTASTVNAAAIGPNPATASTAPTTNGVHNPTPSNFTPMTTFPGSNHGLPYELTDLLVSFKEYKGIFKCIREVHSNTFTQLAVVSLNSYMREALLIPPTTTVAYPIAHMAATLEFDPDEEALYFEISWVVDHMVRFIIKASTSQISVW